MDTHTQHTCTGTFSGYSFFPSHEQISFVPKITAEPSEESVHMLSSEVFKLCFLGMDLKRRRSESCTIITVGFHNHYISQSEEVSRNHAVTQHLHKRQWRRSADINNMILNRRSRTITLSQLPHKASSLLTRRKTSKGREILQHGTPSTVTRHRGTDPLNWEHKRDKVKGVKLCRECSSSR